MRKRKNPFLLILALILAVINFPSFAKVFYSKEEALKLAFADNAQVEMLSLFPSDEQSQQIEQLAKVKLDSKLISVFVGRKQDSILGYAIIDSHTVRSQTETLLLVLDVQGRLKNVTTLAFNEPPEYQPPERWYTQLLNRTLEQLSFDQDVQGIAGATLSTRAALNSARKVEAIFQILLKPINN